MKVVKTATCPSLSGLSTLTYEIGCNNNEVSLRLVGNSGSGTFDKGWVSTESILAVDKSPITSGILRELFPGKSSNSGGFILAVLLSEKLVERCADNTRHYKFKAEIKKSIAALLEPAVSKTGKKVPA